MILRAPKWNASYRFKNDRLSILSASFRTRPYDVLERKAFVNEISSKFYLFSPLLGQYPSRTLATMPAC